MSAPLRVGLVGCGIGRQHLDAYRSLPELFTVEAICDVDEAKARDVAAAYAIERAVTDLGALCRRDEVDVVDICTPPYLHAAQTLQVLEAGKHVICEKPLCGSLEDADRVIAAEKRSGRRVMPIFQYRFGRGVQKLRLLVERGIAGRAFLTTVETAWRRRPAYYAVPWRSRWATELGGPVVNLAIHAHDLLYYVLGPAKTVSAHLTTLVNPIETEDCAAVSLEMADGSLATLAMTTGSAHEISRHRFCFANLSAESNTAPYQSSHDPWTFTGDTPEADEEVRAALAAFEPGPEGFAGQFARYHEALRTGGELPVTLADARAALELITAIYHSARSRAPVPLPLDAAHPLYGGWQAARGG
ncbi:MAG TPA: Gfo/Idh/MocA family oxidoreductase [Methylomirabilota bacterium]